MRQSCRSAARAMCVAAHSVHQRTVCQVSCEPHPHAPAVTTAGIMPAPQSRTASANVIDPARTMRTGRRRLLPRCVGHPCTARGFLGRHRPRSRREATKSVGASRVGQGDLVTKRRQPSREGTADHAGTDDSNPHSSPRRSRNARCFRIRTARRCEAGAAQGTAGRPRRRRLQRCRSPDSARQTCSRRSCCSR